MVSRYIRFRVTSGAFLYSARISLKPLGFALGVIDPLRLIAVRLLDNLFGIAGRLGDDPVVVFLGLIDQPFHVLIGLIDFVECRFDLIGRIDILKLHGAVMETPVIPLGNKPSSWLCSSTLTEVARRSRLLRTIVEIHVADDPPGDTFRHVTDGLTYIGNHKEEGIRIGNLILNNPGNIDDVVVGGQASGIPCRSRVCRSLIAARECGCGSRILPC